MFSNQTDSFSDPFFHEGQGHPSEDHSQNEPEVNEEQPPDYDHFAPIYTPQSYHTPLQTYHLRATTPTHHILVPFGPGNNTSYELVYKSTTSLNFLSKKPDVSVSRVTHDPSNGHRTRDDNIATIDFPSSGPVPWYPRAVLSLKRDGNAELVQTELICRDYTNWTFTFSNTSYVWTLRSIPYCLELSPVNTPTSFQSTNLVLARFTYSALGNLAHHGADVGTLDIFADALTSTHTGEETVIGSCVAVVRYFKSLGKKYRNEGVGGSMAGGLLRPDRRVDERVGGVRWLGI